MLRSRIASLNAAERIQHYAQRQGMIFPEPEQFEYLRSRRGDALKASHGLTAPLDRRRRPAAFGAQRRNRSKWRRHLDDPRTPSARSHREPGL